MRKTRLFRHVSTIALAAFLLAPSLGYSQRGGAAAPAIPRPTISNQPTQPTPAQPTNPDYIQPIFLSGRVKVFDGTPLPSEAEIELVCNSNTQKAGYTDSKGNFTVQPKQQGQGFDGNRLFGCELRASLGGFLSSSISLESRTAFDSPDVGTIFLKRLGDAGEPIGYTVSVTTAMAPKDARKEYERGLASAKREKWDDAEQAFRKAVGIYPKYAVAWYELGRACRQEKKFDDAGHALQQAIDIEPKFISPYTELTALAFVQQKFDDVAKYSAEVMKLAPFASAEIYFYNGVANANLHNADAAEKSALEALKRDPQHKVPRINQLLGIILADKHDYKGAVENLRLYLQFSPAASDAALVQQQIKDFEKAGAAQ
jgi:tetratricopeptide (TPR) repeat protein